MSKIKDLYAIENGIDDLMPVEEKHIGDYERAVQDMIVKDIEDIKKQLEDGAEYRMNKDDEDHDEVIYENYYGQCHGVAEDYLCKLIEEQHIDLSDDDFNTLHTWLGDWLADELAYFEAECVDNMRKEYEEDKKYWQAVEDERNGKC